jgi:hypothetical protein
LSTIAILCEGMGRRGENGGAATGGPFFAAKMGREYGPRID